MGVFVVVASMVAPGVAASAQEVAGASVRVTWTGASDVVPEANRAVELAERWVPEIERVVFGRRIERTRLIEVRLHGDARIGVPPTYRVPHVDALGVVHLFRFGQSHLAALGHELVHAVLRRENVPYGRFDEEGFAYWVANVVQPSTAGFPTYGYPLDLVVGYRLAAGEGIPLELVRARHRELNLRCSFQTYPLRASFFLFLGERFGADAMREFRRLMGRQNAYELAFGQSLVALEQEWLIAAAAAYERRPDRNELAASYSREPALRSATMCLAGRDF